MAPRTPFMSIPVPGENEDPFFASVTAFQDGVDAWIQATREDAALALIEDGAPWTFDPMGPTLAWAAPIVLGSADGAGAVVVTPGSVPVAPGDAVVCLDIPSRPVTGTLPGTVVVRASLPRDPLSVLLGFIISDRFAGARSAPGTRWIAENLAASTVLSEPNGTLYTNTGAPANVEASIAPNGATTPNVVRFARTDRGSALVVLPGTLVSFVLPDGQRIGSGDSLYPVEVDSTLELMRVGTNVWRVTALGGRWAVFNGATPGREFRGRQYPDRSILVNRTSVAHPAHGGGAGQADLWTPRVMFTLYTGRTGCDNVRAVSFKVTGVNPGAGTWTVAGDQTALFPVGRRFAVRDSGTGDTQDKEYITEAASYAAGPDETTVTIRTGVSPGYILTSIDPAATGGTIYLACLQFGRAGRYRLRGEVTGYNCGGFAAAFHACYRSTPPTYDPVTGAIVFPIGLSEPGISGLSSANATARAAVDYDVDITDPTEELWELAQNIAVPYDAAGDYQAWGVGVGGAFLATFASVTIEEA